MKVFGFIFEGFIALVGRGEGKTVCFEEGVGGGCYGFGGVGVRLVKGGEVSRGRW